MVSLSALYARLSEKGFRMASPRGLTRRETEARAVVDPWVHSSTEALVDSFVAINCLINPEAILIGGRLPSDLIERLAARSPIGWQGSRRKMPAIAPVARAWSADDAPAVGAAIRPFSDRLLPARFALLKSA